MNAVKRLSVRVISDVEEFKLLSDTWSKLLQKCGDENTPFLSHEWVYTWWQHFGHNNKLKLNILLVEKEHIVLGIMPLMKIDYRLALAKFHVLETIGVENCNHIGIFPPEHLEESVAAILAYLDETLTDNFALKLRLVREDNHFLALLKRQVGKDSNNLSLDIDLTTLAPYIQLPESWEEYHKSLSQNRRAVLRKALKRLGDSHSFKLQEYTQHSLEDGISEFVNLHQRRWQSVGIRSRFVNPKMKNFYRDIASLFLARCWLHFSSLTVDGEIASSVFGFVHQCKFYAFFMARNRNYDRYSIGHIHIMHIIRNAIKDKLQEFDLLQGDEPYKFYWTRTARKYLRVVITGKGLLPWLYLKYLKVSWYVTKLRILRKSTG